MRAATTVAERTFPTHREASKNKKRKFMRAKKGSHFFFFHNPHISFLFSILILYNCYVTKM